MECGKPGNQAHGDTREWHSYGRRSHRCDRVKKFWPSVLLLDYLTMLYFSCLVAKKKTSNQRKLIKGSIATMMNSSNIFLRLWRRSGHFLSLESLYIRWSRTLNGNNRVIKANQIYFNASTCKTEVTNQASCGREQINGCNKLNYFAIEFMTLQGFIIIW